MPLRVPKLASEKRKARERVRRIYNLIAFVHYAGHTRVFVCLLIYCPVKESGRRSVIRKSIIAVNNYRVIALNLTVKYC